MTRRSTRPLIPSFGHGVSAFNWEREKGLTPLCLISKVLQDHQRHQSAHEKVIGSRHGFGGFDECGEEHYVGWSGYEEQEERLGEGYEEDIEDEE